MATRNLFVWNDDFSVGIQEVDEQHKDLVDLLNQLHEAIIERHGTLASRNILNRLADYTRIHFTVEESLMRVVNYPEYEEHKHVHEELITQVIALQEKLDTGKAAITFELLHFLKIWLQKHIIESDKQFGQFFLDHGFAPKWSDQVKKSMKKRWSWKFW